MSYTEKTRERALEALPYLVHYAQLRKTVTYKEISGKIGVHHRPSRCFLEYIRDQICIPKKLPLINAIVVNGTTRLPGKSFLPQGTNSLSKEEYKQKFEDLRDEIFAYKKWDLLLKELGLTPI
ncbi:MAG: hypothetical protein WCE45_11290, partial [Sedimentisphaerales bacterium]